MDLEFGRGLRSPKVCISLPKMLLYLRPAHEMEEKCLLNC
jgi:hypothetical protein